jgi:transposase InsO family protein
VKFAFIAEQAGEFPVELLCEVLDVSRSGYYAWRNRPPSAQQERRVQLTQQIAAVHEEHRQVYGSPRICRELQARGVSCSENTVAKLMRSRGIRSKRRRRFVVRTTDSRHDHPIAPNRLNQEFDVARPNQVWAADITYIPTGEGWLYLAVVLDLCSRKVVGWAVDDHLRSELAGRALEMAVLHRRPPAELLHHSDRGVQYACDDYQALADRHGMLRSMSRTGNCYDNAVVESFFATLKTELTHHATYATRAQAELALFEFLEVFYNRKRRHSALDYQSPAEYETSLN